MSNKNPAIRIDIKKKPYYDDLAGKSKNKIFERFIDLFLMAAAHGFKINRRKEVSSNTDSPFKWHNLNNDDVVLLKALALASGEENKVIMDKEKLFRIAEEYAQGGIDELVKKINEPGDKIVNINTILEEDK